MSSTSVLLNGFSPTPKTMRLNQFTLALALNPSSSDDDKLDSSQFSDSPEADVSVERTPAIEQLPPEIMAEIFMQSLPHGRFVTPSSSAPPLIYTQVNRQWRNIAITTPTLWSSLAVPRPRQASANQLSGLEIWLSRSSSTPLSICMDKYASDDQLLMSLLLRHISKWRDIQLSFSRRRLALFHPNSIASQLERLEIFAPQALYFDDVETINSSLLSAPKLRRLVCEAGRTVEYSLRTEWSKLTTLNLNILMTISSCLSILSDATNLTSAAFRNVMKPDVSNVDPSFLHQRLQSFVVSTDQDVARLFQSLTLPSLSELVITTRIGYVHPWPRNVFREFLERSTCQLTSLNFYFTPLGQDDLLDCLSSQRDSSIRELTVQMDGIHDNPVFSDRMLDMMSNKDDGSSRCLCPRLEVLALYQCVGCTEGKLADMIRSRLRPSTRLRSDPLFVSRLGALETLVQEKEIDSLRELRQQGLVLKVYNLWAEEQAVEDEGVDSALLATLRREGMRLRSYVPDTGSFEDIE